MEDKRITKTKKSLKTALIEMLDREDFEHISITELCRKAEVSRDRGLLQAAEGE